LAGHAHIRPTRYYFHTDHLGSISVITDQFGSVVQRLSYDAWGKSRLPNGADGQPSAPPTTRGFTAQEELTVSGLVHRNGRVYDPMFGRMISADPTVPDPLDPQAFNRYSYVGNDPLTFTDLTATRLDADTRQSHRGFPRPNRVESGQRDLSALVCHIADLISNWFATVIRGDLNAVAYHVEDSVLSLFVTVKITVWDFRR
jgi:RHS repeat-associated protein